MGRMIMASLDAGGNAIAFAVVTGGRRWRPRRDFRTPARKCREPGRSHGPGARHEPGNGMSSRRPPMSKPQVALFPETFFPLSRVARRHIAVVVGVRPGDVLLYQGEGLLAWAIQFFDGSRFS